MAEDFVAMAAVCPRVFAATAVLLFVFGCEQDAAPASAPVCRDELIYVASDSEWGRCDVGALGTVPNVGYLLCTCPRDGGARD